MPSVIATLFFFCALAIGWWLGRRSLARPPAAAQETLRARVHSMHNLLERHSDDALESLSQGLVVSPETLESHLHVGNLFRRRGDIEKAIHIHQDLLGRAGEDGSLVAQVRLELARDYIAGGLLGSAEELLDELTQQGDEPISLEALDEQRLICEREKSWSRAIELAARLVPSRPELSAALANYYCELAQEKARSGDRSAMQELLREARRVDRHCVRALLMRLDCELWRQDQPAAVATLGELVRDAKAFLGEIVPVLRRHDGLARPEILACLRELAGSEEMPPAVLAMLAASGLPGQAQWCDRLLQRVERHPSWQGVGEYLEVVDGKCDKDSPTGKIAPIIIGLYKTMARYRCGKCGFAGRELHWQCPSCHAWNALRPVISPL
ncbi:lipopolysaccharide biosynthesis regulator YciM [Pseudomonas nitritireducens]|uniref:Lipopolysaccharide biosynthesis regulator YciM n=1 Tax=Pseudomonas nitroreducens TaxID=46680 RepID=A0A7W7KJY2_PSENT|nr:tetratricopeptide repeat protein [Pseudomonas nitritireducens]MBB4863679.1 lipopolysaccharide biosynthesis regulator YciM [Pseudomonas nitritireducens]